MADIITNTLNAENNTENTVVTEKENNMEQKTFNNNGRIIIDENGNFVALTETEKERLFNKIKDCINFFGNNGTYYPLVTDDFNGINKIINVWFENNKWIIQKIANSPYFDEENYRLDFEKGIKKSIDVGIVKEFLNDFRYFNKHSLKPKYLCAFSYKELRKMTDNLKTTLSSLLFLPPRTVNSIVRKQLEEDFNRYKGYMARYEKECYIHSGKAYDKEEHEKMESLNSVIQLINENICYHLDKNMETEINKIYPDLKVKAGQKTSRVLQKIATLTGFDKYKHNEIGEACSVRNKVGTTSELENHTLELASNYNEGDYFEVEDTYEGVIKYKYHDWYDGRLKTSEMYVNRKDRIVAHDNSWWYENHKKDYAAASAKAYDGLAEREIQEHLFLSCDIIDWLTMSVGTNWKSCMTIDIGCVIDNGGRSYHGMYSGGVFSYMLDNCSILLFSIGDKAYETMEDNGEPTLRKKMRQIYQVEPDGKALVQGRLYPYDQTDNDQYAEPEDYTQYRVIVQDLIHELWGTETNMWKKSKRRSSYWKTDNESLHYRDYDHYDNCNVSYNVNEVNDDEHQRMFYIGHGSICPKCGGYHSNAENIFCKCCTTGVSVEEHYCEYHGEYEEHVEDDWFEYQGGYICRDAYENGDFFYCERCSCLESERNDDAVLVDGHFYCCESCANADGYYYLNNYSEWHHEDEFTYSDIEDENILYDDARLVIINEYGDSDYVYDDYAIEYDGQYYFEEDCVETEDGTLVPKWLCTEVVNDETAEVTWVITSAA